MWGQVGRNVISRRALLYHGPCHPIVAKPITACIDASKYVPAIRRNKSNYSHPKAAHNDKNQGSSLKSTSVQTGSMDLNDAKNAMNRILDKVSSLSSSQSDQAQNDEHIRRELFLGTKSVFGSLKQSVEDGKLQPWGKQGRELSRFLESVLLSYSRLSATDVSMFQECKIVLDTLNNWNLDVRIPHYHYAITVANREHQWKEASNLFWRQIDPRAGHTPVHISVVNPAGLIAVARAAQEQGSSPAEQVFDAVLQMSMVSPTDTAKYVLAAGTALGHVGEWEGAVQYLRNSYAANNFGKQLVSSVMHACLLCGRPDEALQVFDENIIGEAVRANEWQWGGEREGLDPLCRDLAMQAMGSTTGMSATALELFRQTVKEEFTISEEALVGVIGACEHDGDWEGSLLVLTAILDRPYGDQWIVQGSRMLISERAHASSSSNGTGTERWSPDMGRILASAVRTSNSASKFGVSLLFCRLFDLFLPLGTLPDNTAQLLQWDPDANGQLERSLVALLLRTQYEEELLGAIMVSLCGLRCYESAMELFDMAQMLGMCNDVSSNVQLCYSYAASKLTKGERKLIGNVWESAHRHMERVTGAVHCIAQANEELSLQDRDMLESALATAMNVCTKAYQPDASLHLAGSVERKLSGVHGTILTSGMIEAAIERAKSSDNYLSVFQKDSVYAEIINACCSSGRTDEAVDLFESLLLRRSGELSEWKLSIEAGLSAMCAIGRADDAVEIVRVLDSSTLTPETCNVLARSLCNQKKWTEIEDLYKMALSEGCLSEELGIVTMKSVVSNNPEGRLRILRTIVEDTVKLSGIDSIAWMKSRYWRLKKYLGGHDARLLLWWNDAKTYHLDELELALEECEKQQASGLKLRMVVVRLILAHANAFEEGDLSEKRTELARVPRTNQEWVVILQGLMEECRDSSIHQDADLVHEFATALGKFGCYDACVRYVEGALTTGVRLHTETLRHGLQCAKRDEQLDLSEHKAHDFEMLVDAKENNSVSNTLL